MKVAFAGTPDFAATILDGLVASAHDVGLVISQPDARRGRGRRSASTAVARTAREAGLLLVQPARISEVATEISGQDALVVAAYGQILRPDALYAAQHGAWNVHASLLPRHRGAAPVERSIIEGDPETGVTIMRMDEGLDTGPIALQRRIGIPPNATGGEVTATLARLGAEAIVEGLNLLETGELNLTEQDSLEATYASKLSDEDRVIRWESGAREVHNLVRALAPRIGARTFHPDFEGPLKIWETRVLQDGGPELAAGEVGTEGRRILVGCGLGAVEVLELQAPGARRLRSRDFLLGRELRGSFSARN